MKGKGRDRLGAKERMEIRLYDGKVVDGRTLKKIAVMEEKKDY